jgi:hypothetical protein
MIRSFVEAAGSAFDPFSAVDSASSSGPNDTNQTSLPLANGPPVKQSSIQTHSTHHDVNHSIDSRPHNHSTRHNNIKNNIKSSFLPNHHYPRVYKHQTAFNNTDASSMIANAAQFARAAAFASEAAGEAALAAEKQVKIALRASENAKAQCR